jgi:anaerobic glycerol-3-phosphate dehydrogenase
MKRALRNTTLYLRGVPTSLVRELKAQAARRGLTLTALAIAGLTRALGTESQDDLKPLEADMAWYDAHQRQLLRRYAGEYLAIADRRVLDHDPDFSALARRVFAKVGVRPIFMPQCVPSDQIVHLRSLRRVPA